MSTALTISPQGAALVPSSIEDAQRVADLLAASTLVPDSYRGKPANCYMAIQYGSELGLTPVASLMSICVIKGKPSLYAAAMVGLVMASGKARYFDCVEATTTVATYETHRHGSKNPRRYTFTYDDAKRAELLGGMYSKWPQRMLDARAKAFLCKDVYADVLLGMSSYEEILDIEPAHVVDTEKFSTPELPPPEAQEDPGSDAVSATDQILGCATTEELKGLMPELAKLEGTEREDALKLFKAQRKTVKGAQ